MLFTLNKFLALERWHNLRLKSHRDVLIIGLPYEIYNESCNKYF